MLTIEQQKTIIRLYIIDLFQSEGIGWPLEAKIDQTAERIIEAINSD